MEYDMKHNSIPLLVIPPSKFLIDDKAFPSLGILWIATALTRSAGGRAPHVLDLAGLEDYANALVKHLQRCPHEVVAITCTTPQFPAAVRLLRRVKAVYPDVVTVVGGPHPTVQPASAVQAGFDRVVVDDGMAALDVFAPDYSGPKIRRGLLTDMDTWGTPARHLIDIESYHARLRTPRGDEQCTSMLWSFGCPYRCTFCCGRDLIFYRKLRTRSPDFILGEMKVVEDMYGIRSFWVFDDEVNLKKDWLESVCTVLHGTGYYWRAFIKANLFTEDVARMMAYGGCVETCTGVESGSARILKDIIQKETTPEINARWVQLSKEHGMRTKAFVMVGHPSETYEDVMATREWLIENKPDNFDVSIMTPYPGSPVYNARYPQSARADFHTRTHADMEQIDFPEIDFSQDVVFYKGIPGEYRTAVSTPVLGSDDLVALRDQIDREAREALGIPLYQAGMVVDVPPWQSAIDHSMGQSGR